MYLVAVHDDAGTILAAVIDDGEHPVPVPVAEDGLTVARIELPAELAETPLDTLCTRMRVDARTGRLVDAPDAPETLEAPDALQSPESPEAATG